MLLAISKELKLRPRLVSKPELVIKYSSTTTDIAGSVLSLIFYFGDGTVKETEVSG
jgi:hypothetical protein